jgi:hypothetical protein
MQKIILPTTITELAVMLPTAPIRTSKYGHEKAQSSKEPLPAASATSFTVIISVSKHYGDKSGKGVIATIKMAHNHL